MEILKKNKILTSFIILVVALVAIVNIYMIFLYESVKISASLVLFTITLIKKYCKKIKQEKLKEA
ncbi:MAG: hypothetical protein J6J33_03420 [Clostridia bacterium]|nr:hypothetical protein [Clostridia bacterium]